MALGHAQPRMASRPGLVLSQFVSAALEQCGFGIASTVGGGKQEPSAGYAGSFAITEPSETELARRNEMANEMW